MAKSNRNREKETNWQERGVQKRRVKKRVQGGKKLSCGASEVGGNERGQGGAARSGPPRSGERPELTSAQPDELGAIGLEQLGPDPRHRAE